MKIAFSTLGCKVNQYDTEAMMDLFRSSNHNIVSFDDYADVYIINTCTVTSMSDRKSRQMIRKAKKQNPDALVVVSGCYAQASPDEVIKIEGVGLIVGSSKKTKIVEMVENAINSKTVINAVENVMDVFEFEETPVEKSTDRTRAYLKIQEGCEQYCSYCIIPFARGRIRSRKLDDLLNEVNRLVKNGFREIVLAGIHVASYGKDLENTDLDLIDIIGEVEKIDGLQRIRLSSIDPTYFTLDNIKRISGLKKLCNHFHLSLQSGCDETLKRMNRKYTTEQYKEVVDNLRTFIPEVSITTDIIVGFPGETDEEFLKTFNFLKDIKLTKLHVFKFSPRKGTKAAGMKDPVKEEIKTIRSDKLLKMSDQNSLEFNTKYKDKVINVLVEQELKDRQGFIEGHTENYIKVICKGDSYSKGRIINVKGIKPCIDFIEGEQI